MLYFTVGRIDMKKTSNLLISDFREGRIGNITLECIKDNA